MAYEDHLQNLAFAIVPVLAFGALMVLGVAMDLWADFVAVRKATHDRPWLVYRRRLRSGVSDSQRN